MQDYQPRLLITNLAGVKNLLNERSGVMMVTRRKITLCVFRLKFEGHFFIWSNSTLPSLPHQ